MAAEKSMQILKAYRNLLKSVDKNIGKSGDGGTKDHFRDFVKHKFRLNGELATGPSLERRLNLANNYAFLLNSVHHQKELLFSYNIAVDRSDEMKKILNKSAASVGLQLPDVYQP